MAIVYCVSDSRDNLMDCVLKNKWLFRGLGTGDNADVILRGLEK